MKSCCEHHRVDCNQGRSCPANDPRFEVRYLIDVVIALIIFVLVAWLSNSQMQDEQKSAEYVEETIAAAKQDAEDQERENVVRRAMFALMEGRY